MFRKANGWAIMSVEREQCWGHLGMNETKKEPDFSAQEKNKNLEYLG